MTDRQTQASTDAWPQCLRSPLRSVRSPRHACGDATWRPGGREDQTLPPPLESPPFSCLRESRALACSRAKGILFSPPKGAETNSRFGHASPEALMNEAGSRPHLGGLMDEVALRWVVFIKSKTIVLIQEKDPASRDDESKARELSIGGDRYREITLEHNT